METDSTIRRPGTGESWSERSGENYMVVYSRESDTHMQCFGLTSVRQPYLRRELCPRWTLTGVQHAIRLSPRIRSCVTRLRHTGEIYIDGICDVDQNWQDYERAGPADNDDHVSVPAGCQTLYIINVRYDYSCIGGSGRDLCSWSEFKAPFEASTVKSGKAQSTTSMGETWT